MNSTSRKSHVHPLVFCFFMILYLAGTQAYAARGDQYWVAQAGVMNVDVNDATPLYAVGTYYGYGINNRISLEGEMISTIEGGEYKDGDIDGRFEFVTLATYGVYRFPFSRYTYLKGKLGLLFEQVTTYEVVENTGTSLDFAAGVGFGWALRSGMTFEFEASQLEATVTYFSLGTHIAF